MNSATLIKLLQHQSQGKLLQNTEVWGFIKLYQHLDHGCFTFALSILEWKFHPYGLRGKSSRKMNSETRKSPTIILFFIRDVSAIFLPSLAPIPYIQNERSYVSVFAYWIFSNSFRLATSTRFPFEGNSGRGIFIVFEKHF